MDSESQLALAHTCKKVYNYHKEQCREETVAFLGSPSINANYNNNDQYRKVFKRWLGNCESHP
jgi:hypothetical protein